MLNYELFDLVYRNRKHIPKISCYKLQNFASIEWVKNSDHPPTLIKYIISKDLKTSEITAGSASRNKHSKLSPSEIRKYLLDFAKSI